MTEQTEHVKKRVFCQIIKIAHNGSLRIWTQKILDFSLKEKVPTLYEDESG